MLFAEYGTAAEWSVAGGTLLLALATFALAWGARKQVAVAADHVVAIQRPLVAPIVTPEWATDVRSDVEVDWIMLKNVGLGPAYNVKGALYWTGGAGGASSIQTTPLGSGDRPIRALVQGEGIVINWPGVSGFLRYLDSGGTEWQTPCYAGARRPRRDRAPRAAPGAP
jgi:hypothetical protein